MTSFSGVLDWSAAARGFFRGLLGGGSFGPNQEYSGGKSAEVEPQPLSPTFDLNFFIQSVMFFFQRKLSSKLFRIDEHLTRSPFEVPSNVFFCKNDTCRKCSELLFLHLAKNRVNFKCGTKNSTK